MPKNVKTIKMKRLFTVCLGLFIAVASTMAQKKDNRGAPAYVTDFWIYTLNTSEMILVYPDNGAFSGWSEGTYWNFKKK